MREVDVTRVEILVFFERSPPAVFIQRWSTKHPATEVSHIMVLPSILRSRLCGRGGVCVGWTNA